MPLKRDRFTKDLQSALMCKANAENKSVEETNEFKIVSACLEHYFETCDERLQMT